MLTIFLYRNFITMSSQLNCMVPLFDGSNYCTWATSMTAFLCSQQLWAIVSGRESRPSDLPSGRAAVVATSTTPAQLAIPAPTQEEVSERQRAQREWTDKDDQALGMIQLQLSHSLYYLCAHSSWHTWKNLEDNFGKPGAAMIFTDFKVLMAFRLTGGNPAPEISKIITLLECLCANHCKFNGFIQSMILLNVLPQRWDYITSVYIQETEVNDFNLIKIREQIIGEWEHSNAGKTSTSTNKLSVVKRKGKSPQFNSQKQNANDNKAKDQGQTDNKQSKHGKKKPRTEKSSSHNHLHLASVGALVPPPPPPAPVVYLWAKDIPANTPPGLSVMTGNKDCLFYQLLSHMGLKQGAQAFTGAPTTRPNTFPHVNTARDLTDKIGVTKNSLNLKRLENITEHSY